MPSERIARRRDGKLIGLTLASLKADHERQGRLIEALEHGAAALAEEPQARLTSKLVLEYAAFSGTIQRAWCSECTAALLGYVEDVWKFCPACGASLEAVEREVGPHERENRQSAGEILRALQAAP